MFLKYLNVDGKRCALHLAGRTAVTFGRSSEADVCIPDAKVSRIHAEIRTWDGDYVIKDFKSRNGTYVNGIRVETAVLKAGDVIRVGPIEFHLGKGPEKGTRTIIREVTEEMDEGKKGYRTVLREIVQSAEDQSKPRKS
jgi:pSer/pThr/pTyr-binding forkhead associated (FHA) protein